MFLHPPQWWRDFCTVCKSLTRVASVGYTTNESSRLRCCQECTLSFRAPIGIDHRKKRIEQCRRTVYGLPLSLLIQKLWVMWTCVRETMRSSSESIGSTQRTQVALNGSAMKARCSHLALRPQHLHPRINQEGSQSPQRQFCQQTVLHRYEVIRDAKSGLSKIKWPREMNFHHCMWLL